MGKYYVNFVSEKVLEGVFHNERTINWDIYKGFPLFPHLSTWINWGKSGQWKSKNVEKWRTILFHTDESGKGEEKNY